MMMDRFLGLIACALLIVGLAMALKKHKTALLVIGLGFFVFAVRDWLADYGQLWLMSLLMIIAFGQFVREWKLKAKK